MEWFHVLSVLAALISVCLADREPPLSLQDRLFLERLPIPRMALPAGFKAKYVLHGGAIKDTKPTSGHFVEIGGSPGTSNKAVYEAALIVSLSVRHMPVDVFNRLTQRGSLGIFNKPEKITIYPEFYSLKDTPECKGTCAGHCSHTCTFDGRKYESLGGISNTRALIQEDNVLCTASDPYHRHDNIVVHEFAHIVQKFGFDSSHISKVSAAYNHAKSANLWVNSAYSMANYQEYFAEGAGAFFNVNRQSTTGGMNRCNHASLCDTEAHARDWMKKHDPQLFNLLSYAYTNNHPEIPSHIKICQSL